MLFVNLAHRILNNVTELLTILRLVGRKNANETLPVFEMVLKVRVVFEVVVLDVRHYTVIV